MLTLEGVRGPVSALAFAPDGATLVGTGQGGRIYLWSPPADIGVRSAHSDTVQALAFSPDGRYLASGGLDRLVNVWDLNEPRRMVAASSQKSAINSVAFVGPKSVMFGLAQRSSPSPLSILDLPGGSARPMSYSLSGGVRALAALPDRRLAAWATVNKLLRVQDITRPAERDVVLRKDCRALALSHDGRRLAVTSDWEVLLFDLAYWGQDRGTGLGRHLGVVTSVAFGPDGQTLFSGGQDGVVRVWDLDRMTERAAYTWPVGKWVTSVSVSPDGLRAAAGGTDGPIVVWDLD